MCIVLLTTAHPDYALIVIDNRDEFILRPTSRPHWWKTLPKPVAPPPGPVLSTPSSASASAAVSAASSTAPSSSVNSAIPTPLSSSPPRETLGCGGRGPSPLSSVATPRTLDVNAGTSASTRTTTNIGNPNNGNDETSFSSSYSSSGNSRENVSPSQPPPAQQIPISILSSRDLQRAERGTWLGITRGGSFAVLTNYRETDANDTLHPIHAARSRGGMVTAWLAADPEMSLSQFVEEMLRDGGTKGVGGFSLLCGKLRRKKLPGKEKEQEIEPLAIISNRYDCADEVPWVAQSRGETIGLSNTCFGDPDRWPKIENGKALLQQVIREAVEYKAKNGGKSVSEDELVERLFRILDTDTMPVKDGWGLEDYLFYYKKSIFIPPLGDEGHKREMEEMRKSAPKKPSSPSSGSSEEDSRHFHEPPPTEEEEPTATAADSMQGFSTGMYGTQRQTVMLVDWEGNVRFTERALFDAWGREVPRGKGDMTFRFAVEGWDGDDDGEKVNRETKVEGRVNGDVTMGSK